MSKTTEQVNPKFDNTVDMVLVKFRFKKIKDEATGLESQRPTVELELPLISVEGAIEAFNAGDRQLALIIETMRDLQIARAREIINEKEDISAENFPYDALSWKAIANMPKAERRGGGISKETWEEFAKDYIAVMPGVTGKDVEKVANAARICLNKFNSCKTNRPVIRMLKDQLGLYVINSPNAETFQDCVEFLINKADALLNISDADLLVNL